MGEKTNNPHRFNTTPMSEDSMRRSSEMMAAGNHPMQIKNLVKLCQTQKDSKMQKIININTRCYPSQNFLGYVEIKAVLVEGDIGDYACYVGCGTDQFVAAQGDKISFEEANIHFCGSLEKSKYRER